MKKITLLALAAFGVIGQMNAQNQRMVLIEEFTQASCPPCAAQNPGFNALLESNLTKVIPIKYQTSWPGVDPMNAQTEGDVGPRVTYYGISGVPTGVQDGSIWTGTNGWYNGAPGNYTQAQIDAEYAVTSPLLMTLTHSLNATLDSVTVNLSITASQAVNGTLELRLAMIEKNIGFTSPPGSNGEKVFSYVTRKMYPDANGTAIANMTSSQVLNFTWTLALPAYIYNKDEVGMVAWVQDDATKNVLQAAISQPEYYPSTAIGGSTVVCASNFSPSVTLTNTGSITLTSCTINYSVDGGSNQTQAWTGTLAPNANTNIPLPAVTGLTNGQHKISCYPSAPNGIATFTYSSHSSAFNFVSYPSAGVLPVTQSFGLTTFPPVGFGNINANGGGVWSRSTVSNGNGNGSAKADCYDFVAGNNLEFYLPESDFSTAGQTHASVDFSEAYAWFYSASQGTLYDSLAILTSTNCGSTWQTVWEDGGTDLATTGSDSLAFTPTAAQWRTYSVSLDNVIGQANVLVKFVAISKYGNNIYLDNINLRYGAVNGIHEIPSASNFFIYPNPSAGEAGLSMNLASSTNVKIEIYNYLGQRVSSFDAGNLPAGIHQLSLNTADLSSGLYNINIITGAGTIIRKLVKSN